MADKEKLQIEVGMKLNISDLKIKEKQIKIIKNELKKHLLNNIQRCEYCGKYFWQNHGKQIYCDDKCKKNNWYHKNKK